MLRIAALILLTPSLAFAHATTLTGAAPSADSVAQGAPNVVELTFSDPIQPKSSRITVKSTDGKRMDVNDDHAVGDAKHLAVGLKNLLPGKYLVTWKVIGADNQPAQGSFGFTVSQ